MLRDLTVDRLKIDASFVDGIAHSQRQQHLVKAIVALAKGLGIETVAEGVETEESWITLANLGCDVAQGYLICRPVPLAGAGRMARHPPIDVGAWSTCRHDHRRRLDRGDPHGPVDRPIAGAAGQAAASPSVVWCGSASGCSW